MKTKDWLPEQIKTVSKLCEVADILIKAGRKDLLPTILELLYEQAQTILDEQCIVGEE